MYQEFISRIFSNFYCFKLVLTCLLTTEDTEKNNMNIKSSVSPVVQIQCLVILIYLILHLAQTYD
jgi:fumarate reductase subunit C